MDVLIVIGGLLGAIALGVPIAYALALSALAGAWWIGIPTEAVMLQISSGVSKFAMLTIPFFVLAGAIMAEGGMARRLVAFANVIVGLLRLRGGLSLVNIMATTFMSGISGSSVADASAIGSVMIPQMEKSGYPRVFSTNVTIAASVQGLLVPPSHNAVIYSLATGGTISIASLFMAGVMPGLLLGLSLMLLCVVLAYRNGHPTGEAVPLRDALKITIDAAVGAHHAGDHSRRHPWRRLHRHRGGGGRLRLCLLRHDVCLSRLSLARFAALGLSDAAHRRDGHDADRLCRGRRLHDGADADAGEDHRLLPDIVEQQICDPAADQRSLVGARMPRRYGAVDPDHDADSAPRRHEVRRRPRALRHDHADEPGDRPLPSAGRRDLVCRLRRRPRPDGGRHAADLAVLRRHVPGADGGHLHPR